MFYILSLFWLLSISGLLTIVFNRKFEMVLTLSMILGTLMLYPFGYINHISYGYYLSWLFVLLRHEVVSASESDKTATNIFFIFLE